MTRKGRGNEYFVFVYLQVRFLKTSRLGCETQQLPGGRCVCLACDSAASGEAALPCTHLSSLPLTGARGPPHLLSLTHATSLDGKDFILCCCFF